MSDYEYYLNLQRINREELATVRNSEAKRALVSEQLRIERMLEKFKP
jgi:hypothetical protein